MEFDIWPSSDNLKCFICNCHRYDGGLLCSQELLRALRGWLHADQWPETLAAGDQLLAGPGGHHQHHQQTLLRRPGGHHQGDRGQGQEQDCWHRRMGDGLQVGCQVVSIIMFILWIRQPTVQQPQYSGISLTVQGTKMPLSQRYYPLPKPHPVQSIVLLSEKMRSSSTICRHFLDNENFMIIYGRRWGSRPP